MITSFLIRTIGPILLRNATGGGAGGTTTKAPEDDFDDFGSDEDTNDNEVSNKIDINSNGSKVSISLPTFAPDSDSLNDSSSSQLTDKTTTVATPARINLLTTFDDDDDFAERLRAFAGRGHAACADS